MRPQSSRSCGAARIAATSGHPLRLAALLAQCREEEPEVEIRLYEVPLVQQLKGLRDDLYDAGFSQETDAGDDIIVQPVGSEPLPTKRTSH